MQSVFQRTDEGRCNLESVMIGGGPFTYELQQFFEPLRSSHHEYYTPLLRRELL